MDPGDPCRRARQERGRRLSAEELERRGAAFDAVFGHEHASHLGRVELQTEVEPEDAVKDGAERKGRVRDPVSSTVQITASRRCHGKHLIWRW